MRIPGAKTARLGARWLRSRFSARALVVGYHRVADGTPDPYGLCVSPRIFEEHLRVLKEIACPVDPDTLAEDMADGRLRAKAVLLSFDDGYSDLSNVVAPLLERYEIPAVVFVPSGWLGREFWWDRLARLAKASRFPRILIDAFEYVGIPFGRDARRSRQASPATYSSSAREHGQGRTLAVAYRRLLSLAPADRDRVLDQLESIAGRDAPAARVRVMSTDETAALSRDRWVTVGSHTVSHRILSHITAAECKQEIRQSKIDLEHLTGEPVTAFSYPNGDAPDMAEQVLRSSGYQTAFTSVNDVVRAGSNSFRIPRFWPGSVSGEAFSRWLRLWL